MPQQSTSQIGDSPDATTCNIQQLEALPLIAQTNKNATQADTILCKVLQHAKHGWPTHVTEAIQPYACSKTEITVEDDCVPWGICVIILKS